MKIRKNDTVIVIAGKDRGKKGKVRRAFPNEDKVVVEGLNMIKRHSRARRAARQAGIIELEAPIHVSNVMLLCDKCGKPTRVSFRFLADGKRARICNSCREVID
ncbi:MAG: 50S ribosomal protein L24 [Dehalococcoidia bacterium]|jgi:large subunit ribosomal protein L24|nr:50S ribosomal protein L24 [Dehalococcoidia bacterium]